MIDGFVLLTPLVLLPIFMLLVFIGCYDFDQFKSHESASFGKAGDIPLPGDYDRLGHTQAAFYDPTNQTWHLWRNGDIFAQKGMEFVFQFGMPGDIPVPGDYGSNFTEPAVYRSSTGTWHLYDIQNSKEKAPFPSVAKGQAAPAGYLTDGRRTLLTVGDTPVPGVFQEKGQPYLVLYRSLDKKFHVADLKGVPLRSFALAQAQSGDVLVPGDYGSGQTLAIFSISAGSWVPFDLTGKIQNSFGYAARAGDIPLPPIQYRGEKEKFLAVVLKLQGGLGWHFLDLKGNQKLIYPTEGDIPVQGDYEGDGFRLAGYSATGVWSTPYEDLTGQK